MKGRAAALLTALAMLLSLTACAPAAEGPSGSAAPPAAAAGSSSPRPESTPPAEGTAEPLPPEQPAETEPPPAVEQPAETTPGGPADRPPAEMHPYLRQLVEETAASLMTPEMGEFERAKAAFDYMIDHTSMGEPIGLELWRVHGGGEEPIPFVEQRALSPLRFGVGMCEDYAAALTLLLRGMGLEALYLPGLTYSVEGNLVDHAWTMVKIDGTWYHLDCQLEDNISRHGWVRYKYFLRGDGTMAGSHRWGQNLIDAGLLPPEQAAQVAESWLTPACPRDYPTPERHPVANAYAPMREQLAGEAAAEITAWETKNGPLPPMTLNTIPPVFGLEGFGPPNEG